MGCAVKQRMRSVTNIQKITKAMKMVAASKMRIAQASTEKSRGIIQPFVKLLGDLPGAHLFSHGYWRGCSSSWKGVAAAWALYMHSAGHEQVDLLTCSTARDQH